MPAKTDDDFLVSAINDIEANSEADAGGIGGIQSYVVLAFFEDEPDKPLARFTFRVAGDNEEDEGEISSEPPNRIGITSQLMRHNEAIMRTGTIATGQVVAVMQRTIASLSEANERLTTQRLESFQLIEELQSQKHERDLMASREAMKQQMIRETFEKATLLLPVVVNKLTGKTLLPERKSGQEIMIKEFMNSLTPEQANGLQNILKPEQLAVVLTMMDGFAKEDMKDAEKHQLAVVKVPGEK
ncbi:MAG: hypothetical protein V1784_07150 [bacterium]